MLTNNDDIVSYIRNLIIRSSRIDLLSFSYSFQRPFRNVMDATEHKDISYKIKSLRKKRSITIQDWLRKPI